MARPKSKSRTSPVARATFVFLLVMAPSWWVLAIALTGGGCSFEPSALKGHGVLQHVEDDTDGGE